MIEIDDIKVGDEILAVENGYLNNDPIKYPIPFIKKHHSYTIEGIVHEAIDYLTPEWYIKIVDEHKEDHFFSLKHISPSNMKDNNTMFQLSSQKDYA